MIKRASALAATLALTVPATADAGFKEPVKVLWQHTGDASRYYAWGVAPLEDIDHDGADEVIAGEPGATRTASRSPTPATSIATASTTSSAARRARPATPKVTPTSIPAAPARCCTRSRAT